MIGLDCREGLDGVGTAISITKQSNSITRSIIEDWSKIRYLPAPTYNFLLTVFESGRDEIDTHEAFDPIQ